MNIWYWLPLAELNYIRYRKDVNFSEYSSYKVLNYVSVQRVEQNLSISILDRRHISWKFPLGFYLFFICTFRCHDLIYFSILQYQLIVPGRVAPEGLCTLPLRHTHWDVGIKREWNVTKTEALGSRAAQVALSLSFVSYWAWKALPHP